MGTLISFLQKIGLWKKSLTPSVVKEEYPEHPLNAVNATKIIEDRLAEIASEKKVEKKVTAKEIKAKVVVKKAEDKSVQPKTPVRKPALKRNPPKPKV